MSNSSVITLDDIDTSFWLTRNKTWVEERKIGWLEIEKMLLRYKSKKGVAIIKQYYLKGKMPDWLKLKEWENPERHLDIFCFIWLHPSTDENVLVPLRDAYMISDLIVEDDIRGGLADFLSNGTVMACQANYLDPEEPRIIVTGRNESLFRILMGDLSRTKYEIQGYSSRDPVIQFGRPKRFFEMPKSSFTDVCSMSAWLRLEKLEPINRDMLFQYDLPLEWWYQSCETHEDYFDEKLKRLSRKYIEKALYEIYHFDTEKEGNTCRTRFVHKIKSILDNRPFMKDFKEMWTGIKSGDIKVQNAFQS